MPGYRDPWLRLGAAAVVPIYPARGDELPGSTLEELRRCTAIFIGGGWTRRYHELYAASAVAAVIREQYAAGIPFGGVSAGALIAAKAATISENDDPELAVAEGIGLLDNLMVGVHVDTSAGLPRLIAAMEQTGVLYGLGIDEPVCGEIRNGREGLLHGDGRAYLLRRLATAGRFELRVLEAGAAFALV